MIVSQDINTLMVFTVIVLLLFILAITILYAYFIRKKTQLLLKQRANENLFRNELASTQIEVKENTLNYVGQELHDDIGQKLSVVKLMINQMKKNRGNVDEKTLDELDEIIGDSIREIRGISRSFITEQVKYFGFIDSLENDIGRINRLDQIEIDFSYNDRDIDINPQHSLILYRMTQELINNALKHSNARVLIVKVLDSSDRLQIIVSDNGKGFNPSEELKGTGLKNICNRSQIIGAQVDFEAAVNKGTTATINYKKPAYAKN